MSVHFKYLAKLKAKFLPPAADKRVEPEGDVDQIFLCKMMLHAADISNPAKPRLHYFEWTDRVLAEFYAQGDQERALGDEGPGISTFFDREKPNVIKW